MIEEKPIGVTEKKDISTKLATRREIVQFWADVKSVYPLTFEKVLEFSECVYDQPFSSRPHLEYHFNVRYLYDFFDEHKIRCAVEPKSTGTFGAVIYLWEPMETKPEHKHWKRYYSFDNSHSRMEADVTAFLKAFDLVEAELSN